MVFVMVGCWIQHWLIHFSHLEASVQAKAAQLCFGIVKNHPMVDGNKRLGTHVMLVFLALNGYELSYTQKELSDAILDLASGKTGAEDILRWISYITQHSYADCQRQEMRV